MTAERALMTTAVRQDPTKVSALLHSDFVEIGRSGRKWSREAIIDALASEQDRADSEPVEWNGDEIAPGLFLATFVVRSASAHSRHSSLWDVTSGKPLLRFHQGTPVSESKSS
nr:nuclear transport factor 2 family protein [Microbacterium endophyticum]